MCFCVCASLATIKTINKADEPFVQQATSPNNPIKPLVLLIDPVVDVDKCIGCETCVQVCPVNLFEMQDGHARFIQERVDECTACETCVNSCPASALSMTSK